MDVDAVIAEATNQVADEAKATPVAETTEQTLDTTNEQTANSVKEAEDVGSKPDSELTPEQLAKREANRKSHQNSREAKIRRELREAREKLAQFESKAAAPQKQAEAKTPHAEGAPKEEDYDNFMDFVKATVKFEAKQELLQGKTEAKQESDNSLPPEIASAMQDVAKKTADFAKATPEYRLLYQENQAFVDNMPNEVFYSLLQAENAPLAMYALMKEGKLQDLEDLSPTRMAIEIGKAEERGKSYLKSSSQATGAPTPIESSKGTGRASKSLQDMSVDELMKKFG